MEDPNGISQMSAAIQNYHNQMFNYNDQYQTYLDEMSRYTPGTGTRPIAPTVPVWNPPTVNVQHAAYRYAQKSAITQQLNYVVQNGKGRLVANPKVVVTNGKKATISLTQDYVKKVTSQVLTSQMYVGGGVEKNYEIAKDNGIVVEIVPFISPDGYVSMNLKPNYSVIAEQIYGRGSKGVSELQATLVRSRDFELSNVRVKDGETLVLGGFVQEYEMKSVSKTPILGDLPIIGFLFRNSSTSNQKTEMVLLITPRIIKDSEDVIGGAADL